MKKNAEGSGDQIVAHNYALAFIDLLGQQNELKGCGLLPAFNTSEAKDEFFSVVKNTIASVHDLQSSCEEMFKAYSSDAFSLRHEVPADKRGIYDALKKTNIKMQRWSDGLVAYISLGDPTVAVPIKGLFGLLATCGTMCLVGLGKKRPLRGGLEVAWGVELRDGEIYGCAVARAYNLESKIAQYPRIVVGPNLIVYIQECAAASGDDYLAMFNRKMAGICIEMLVQDNDGHFIINYLGAAFAQYVAPDNSAVLVAKAYEFVIEQSEKWRNEKNTTLSLRYTALRDYFEHHMKR